MSKSLNVYISIIIPLKKITGSFRKETIPALLRQSYQNFEIIVLPDKPTKEKFAKTRIIPTWPKIGPAEKRNLGAQKAKGEILAFIDDDAYPDKNWLKNALSAFLNGYKETSLKKHFLPPSSIAAVCGPGITPPRDPFLAQVSGWMWASFLGAGGAGQYRCWPQKIREVDDFPTFNFIIKKDDFFKIGGFNANFWPGEDSLPPNEEVLIIEQSNNIRRVKIGNLVDEHLEASPIHKYGKSEVSYRNPKNLAVFSFESDYKIRIKPIKAFIRHRKFHEIYKLKLSRGNTITCTDSHSLFTFSKDGRIVPVKIRELKPGDFIVAPRKITILKNIKEINVVKLFLNLEERFIWSGKSSLIYLKSKEYVAYLLENYKEEILGAVEKYNLKGRLSNWKYYGCLPLIVLKNLPMKSYHSKLLKKFKVRIRARGHNNAAEMMPVIDMSEDLLWFLGFMTAEGWMSNPDKIKKGNRWSINLSQKAEKRIFLDRSLKILKNYLGLSFSLYKDKRHDVLNITVNCRVLWCFLQALGLGGYSYQKRVPLFVFSLPKKKIRAFLRGYHAGDSCDYTDGRIGKFGITTSSKEMAKDFALLFLRLGEPFRITRHKEGRKPHYHDQFNIHTFCPSAEELGKNIESRILKNFQDGLPAIDYLLKIARKYHLTSELLKRGVTSQYPNKRDWRKKVTWYHVKRFVRLAKEKIGSVPEIRNLEKILDSDLRFEEILEIKKVKKQPRYTYDLSVGGSPASDNFIAGTFICVHNTKLCHDLVYGLHKKIIYDPRVLVYHHRRKIFFPHLRQIGRYGLHRGYFAKILPKTSRRIRYFLPLLFDAGILLGPIAYFILRFLGYLVMAKIVALFYFLALVIYSLTLLWTGVWVLLKSKDIKTAILVMPTIVISHLFYGLMFFGGLTKKGFKSKFDREKI